MSILPQLISTAVVRVYCIGFLFDFLIASNHVNTQELYNDVKKGKFKTTQHIKYWNFLVDMLFYFISYKDFFRLFYLTQQNIF